MSTEQTREELKLNVLSLITNWQIRASELNAELNRLFAERKHEELSFAVREVELSGIIKHTKELLDAMREEV